MNPITRPAAMLLAGLLLLMSASTLVGEAPEKSPFDGKVLLITTTDGYGAVLEKVEVRDVGKHTFLSGRYPEADFMGRYSGRRAWLNTALVLQILEYDNVDEVRKLYDGESAEGFKSIGGGKLN